VVLVALVLTPVFARAQADTPAPPESLAAPAPRLRAPLLDWSHVQEVYRLAEQWTRAAATPPAGEVAPLRVSGVPALRVTLRWLGMTVGIGDAMTAEQGGEGDVADLAGLTRVATARALAQVLQRLHNQNNPNAAALDPLRDIATQLLVDVQVAHSLRSVQLAAGSPPDLVYRQFIPGFHGLRLHRAGGVADLTAAVIWPGNALAANLSPRSQLLQLLADIKVSYEQIGKIAHPEGPVLERFEVIHMVRPMRHLPATLLQRGHEVLPPGSVDSRTLEAMSQRLAVHLMRWQNPGDGTLAGTYLPTSDRHDPPQASEEDEALAAFALVRWSQVWRPSAGEGDPVNDAQQAAVRIVNNIVRRVGMDPSPSPPTAALALLAIHHSPTLAMERKRDRDDLVKLLLSRIDREGVVRGQSKEKAPALTTPAQALVLAALAVHEQVTRDPLTAKAVALLHSQLWRAHAVGEVAALPWLAMAEVRTEALDLQPALGVPDAAHRADLLRQAADVLMQRQVTAAPEGGCGDIVGGFDLRPSTPAPLAPEPDWMSAYPLMLMALGTRHQLLQAPGAQASDTLKLLLRSGLAARFLAQLMIGESGCYYVRNVETALGGVRLNLWDNRLAVAPHAMTLLATVEFQQTLRDTRELAPAPENAPPAPEAPAEPQPEPASAQPAPAQGDAASP
jgi:hypothetical protein